MNVDYRVGYPLKGEDEVASLINIPDSLVNDRISGKLKILMLIDIDGKPAKINTLESLHPTIDNEVIRVFSKEQFFPERNGLVPKPTVIYGFVDVNMERDQKIALSFSPNLDENSSSPNNQPSVYSSSTNGSDFNNPKLIGGIQSLKVDYPISARKQGVEGTVIVKFIVNKKGEVENPEIVRGLGHGCDAAAIRAVGKLKFEPGTKDGEPIRVNFSIPINFALDQ